MKKYSIIISFLSLWVVSASAQNLLILTWPKSTQDSFRLAKGYYDADIYDLAAPIFMNLQKQYPDKVYLQYAAGASALERSDLSAYALDMLQRAYDQKIKIEELPYNLARAQHLNNKFDEALNTLAQMETTTKNLSKEWKDKINLLKIYCNNAKVLVAKPDSSKIENLGNPPNTTASEYVPVLSADEETMVYTYVGDSSYGGLRKVDGDDGFEYTKYFEDVYITHKKDSVWQPGRNIGMSINTHENDAAVSISPDGQMLFIFRDDTISEGDLYVSYLQGSEWTAPSPLMGDINRGDTWEGSCSMSADGKTLYFASNRKGGFGGRDLYMATRMSDGSWGKVKNLGSKINSKYDEDAPFIHPDGKLLIYSSNGEKSMGNYDVFKTIYNETDTSWSEPENLGYPINTPDRDSYYVLSANGKHGYYSSGRSGGQGLQDIYKISPGVANYKPIFLLVKGMVTLHGQPIEAHVVALANGSDEPFSMATSNSADGKYLLSLKEGNDYKLTFSLKDYADKVVEVKGKNLQEYTEQIINIDFSDTVNIAKTDSVPKQDSVLEVKKPTLSIKEQTAEGLFFRIQIAAYEHPQNYEASPKLKELGVIEKLQLEDGICRITIGGNFTTLLAAEDFLKKVRQAGQADSFTTAVYKGKRVYLDDLVKQGVLKK